MPLNVRELQFEVVREAQHEVLRPSGGGDHAVGQGFLQFSFRSTSFLRTREVFLQSGWAPDGDGAANPYQFAGPSVEHFLILEIENLFPDAHGSPHVEY